VDIFVDGGCKPTHGSGLMSVAIVDSKGHILHSAIIGEGSSSASEYHAILAGIIEGVKSPEKTLNIYTDAWFCIEQICWKQTFKFGKKIAEVISELKKEGYSISILYVPKKDQVASLAHFKAHSEATRLLDQVSNFTIDRSKHPYRRGIRGVYQG
jgi:ribonuclease HI